MDFKSLFVPFRYAPLHKERFKNSKLYLGLKIKCKFETGLRSKKCKLNPGRDTHYTHLQVPQCRPTNQNLQKSVIVPTHQLRE